MWREVPAGGAEIHGHYFPAGTIIGANTWVAHYDDGVFPEAKKFRPERWLEAESNPDKLKEMNQMYMPVSDKFMLAAFFWQVWLGFLLFS
jgi:cytochrome P450